MAGATHLALGVGFALCFGFAALLAAAEASLVRVRRPQVTVAGPTRGTRQLLALLGDLPVALNTILLLALLCQVGAASIAGYWAQRIFGDLAVSASSIAVTALLFVYAEALPKTRAVSAPVKYALRLAPFVSVLTRLLHRPVRVIVGFAEMQSPGPATFSTIMTEPELRASAEEAAEAGEIEPGDAGLIERSFLFGDTTAAAVMVPRHRIVSLPRDCTAVTGLSVSIDTGHRRLPVTAGGLDDIVGHVRLRDLSSLSRSAPSASVAAVTSDSLRCPGDEPIASVLKRMQSSGRWLAIVEDDSGRTEGLLTIEDVVAELVGEISDDAPTALGPSRSRSR